jgi:hypothetical protein
VPLTKNGALTCDNSACEGWNPHRVQEHHSGVKA